MSHRQFQAWQHWLNDQWDEPSRTDAYLMQIACEVRRGNAKHPGQVQLKHFVLRFTPPKPAPPTPETIAASKAVWLGRMGMKADVVEGG
jgi:hypothetical protein